MKAAIEIGDSPYDDKPTYNVTVSNTTVNGYAINDEGISTKTNLWGNKNSMPKDRLNVTVDGEVVYQISFPISAKLPTLSSLLSCKNT